MYRRKIISNSAALLILEVIGKLVPLVTLPQIARALGPSVYGQVGFAASLVAFFGLLAAPGFSTYGTREAARSRDNLPQTVANILGARVLFALLAYGCLAVFTFTLAPGDSLTHQLVLITGLGMIVSSMDLQWLFASQSRMWVISLVGISAQLLTLVLTIGFVHTPRDAKILALMTSLIPGIVAGFVYMKARRDYHVPLPNLRIRTWVRMLPVCFTLGMASLMSLVYDQIDMVMLKYYVADAELGIYSASYRIMGLALSFLFFIGQVYFPLIYAAARRDSREEQQHLKWMAGTMIAIVTPVCLCGILLAEPLSALILGPQFAGAARMVRWLMLNVPATALAIYFGGRLVPHSREKKYLACVVAGAVVNVGLNIIFIPRFGAIAAVFSTIASQLAVAGAAFVFSRDLPRPQVGEAMSYTILACFAMVMGITVVQARYEVPALALLVMGAIVYSTSLWLSRRVWTRIQVHARAA